MIQAGNFCQLNTWGFGTKHIRSFAHILCFDGDIFHVACIQTLSRRIEELPENTSFNIKVETVIPGKGVEAQIVGVANEFRMSEAEKKHFEKLNLELQIY